jgi:ATP-dependent Lon protease
MSSADIAATSEMDHLDQLGAKAFDGFLVRKDLVRKYSRQYPVPTYVVEFLLGRYCASTDPAEIEEGLQIVEKQLQGRTVRTGEEELFKARSRDQGSVKIIDIVRARLDTRSDSYAAEVPSLAIKDAQIDDELVRANERMLTDGFYAEVTLEYDPVIAQERNGRPFRIAGLRPIQMSNPNVLGILAKGRAAFTTDEWRDFLIRSIGIEPTALDERAKMVVLLRMAPFVERNFNLVELGPTRHRQEPSVPADLALLPPDLGRQGNRRQDVRQQRQRPARVGLPIRRGLFRRGGRRLVRSEGRRQHP